MQNDPLRDADFAELYARYRPRLVRLCRRVLREHRHDAEAVAQEAFVRAWEGSDRYSADRPFWPWVSTIAWHLCIDYLREVARDERIEERTKHTRPVAPLEPDERLDALDEAPLVQEALRSLKPRYRRLVQLHHVDGWSYEEVAAFEQVSVESVRGVLKRARALLRASYEHLAGGLVAVPGVAWARRTVDRFVPWVAARVADVRPPVVAAVAVLLGLTLQDVAPGWGRSDGPALPAATSAVEHVSAPENAAQRSTTTTRAHNGTTPASAGGRAPGDGDEGHSAERFRFEHVAVAPNHDVYAAGHSEGTSGPALLRSTDGGRTWERLPADGLPGAARLLFPPAYPADPRIFASTLIGLTVSHDRGRTFRRVSAMIGYAAMAPDFSEGNEVLLSGNAPGWFYDVSSMATVPTGLPVPPSVWWANFAFGSRYVEDGIVYVAAHAFVDPLKTAVPRPVVWVCRPSGCVEAARGGANSGSAPELMVSPVDGTVWAFTWEWLWRSRDGVTFEPIPFPARAHPSAVVFGGGATYLSMSPGLDRGGIYRSVDDGDTWEKVDGDTFPHGAPSLVVLQDGTLLAVQHPVAGEGLFRSADSGATWQRVA